MPERSLMVLRLLWFAMFSSTFMFLVVAYVAAPPPEALEQPPEPMMLLVFGFVGFTTAVLGVMVPMQLQTQALKALKLKVRELPPGERLFNDEASGRSRVFDSPAVAKRRLAAVVQTPLIVGMAMCESVAIFGLMLRMMGFPMTHAIGFFIVAWILMLEKIPLPDRYMRALESAYDADLK